ncbi:inhibitor of the pro-sigma K processing machinery [Oceanobacillus limi]|uniref:Inhibitor of the pro-sigma K processing machinery n=1 Tax=Oceanobacillus limi TaxID=930131 RepID=A0A1I0GTQ2_9BACI|nr:inhibitor of the pro-sigma K processing machinery [Oceanobacillus limi]
MYVSSTLVISIMIALIVILLFVGAPVKPMRFIAQGTVKLGIGVLFLFFFNVIAGSIGLHIPINLFTAVVSGFLGLFGVASLAAIHLFIIP